MCISGKLAEIDINNKNPSDPFSPYYSINGGELKGPVKTTREMNSLLYQKILFRPIFGIRPYDNKPSQPPQPPPPPSPQATQAPQARQSGEEPVTRTKQTQTMRRRTDLRVAEQVNIPRASLAVMGGGSNSSVNVPT